VIEIYQSVSGGFRLRCDATAMRAKFYHVVIPAKAGIQASPPPPTTPSEGRLQRESRFLSGIAHCARDSQKLIAGGSAPAPWVTFFARAKKVTKESTPRSLRCANAARSPARLTKPGARLTRRALGNAPRARSGGERIPPASLRCSARDTGGLANHLIPWRGVLLKAPYQSTMLKSDARGFRVPVARAEYRSPSGGFQASPCSSRAASFSGRRVGERPFGRGTEEEVARSGVSFLLVTFLWTSKEKSPAVGQPPTSTRGHRPLDSLVSVRN
jgi:hypothetical protein